MEYDKSKKSKKNNSTKQINSKIKKSKNKTKQRGKAKDKGKENENECILTSNKDKNVIDDLFHHSIKMNDIITKRRKRTNPDPFKEAPKSSCQNDLNEYTIETQSYMDNLEIQWNQTFSSINKFQTSQTAMKKCEDHNLYLLKHLKKKENN